jgi:psp operon transcriptional activator
LRNVVERAVYRHEDPERAITSIQFDPFQSPWVPADGGASGAAPIFAAPPLETPHPNASPRTDALTAGVSAAPASTADLRGAVNAYEKALLEEALSRSRFNQRATAAALGLSYDQLRHALKRHKLLDANNPEPV